MPRDDTPLPFKMTAAVFHVLLSLVDQDAHAYGIMKSVEKRTTGAVRIAPGSLHFTIGKLLDAGMVEESAGPGEPGEDERRKYFTLTSYGREVVSREATLMAEIVEFARERDLIVGG